MISKQEALDTLARQAERMAKRRETRRRLPTREEAQDNFATYTARYREMKRDLDSGLPVEPAEHRELSTLFQRLTDAQQSRLKGRSPGCLFSRESQGPGGRY